MRTNNPFKSTTSGRVEQSKDGNLKIVNAVDFFDQVNGFYSKEAFLTFGESSRDEDIAQLSKFLELAKTGKKILNTSTPRVDAGGNPYQFVTFLRSGRSSDGVKLITVHAWKAVLEQYQDGLIEINFTLDELIEEARKA